MRFLSFLALGLILLLAACASGGKTEPTTRYVLPDKAGGRLCAFQCRNAFEHCDESCGLAERACMTEVQGQAIRDYEAYARDQFKARAPVELRPRDFERTRQCSAAPCRQACRKTYESCFTGCGGKIVVETPCRFFCYE